MSSEGAVLEGLLNPPPKETGILPLASGVLNADGSEQTVVEFTDVGRVMGYVDLRNMQLGDQVTIRQYMRVAEGGLYQLYAQEVYGNAQPIPIIYITPKETDYGIRITLQQIAGVLREFEYNFLREL